jgi:hypothetical protein
VRSGKGHEHPPPTMPIAFDRVGPTGPRRPRGVRPRPARRKAAKDMCEEGREAEDRSEAVKEM